MYYRHVISVLAATAVFADLAHKTTERQVWRVVPSSADEIRKLRDIGATFELDFWKGPTTVGRAVDFLVTGEKRAEVTAVLERNGLTGVEVYIDDINKLIAQQFKPTPRSTARTVAEFDYSNYHNAEEIHGWMDLVVQEYGGFVTKKQIGVTYKGKPMYVLEFTKGTSSPPKPKIFVDALIHCREWITTASLLYIFKEESLLRYNIGYAWFARLVVTN